MWGVCRRGKYQIHNSFLHRTARVRDVHPAELENVQTLQPDVTLSADVCLQGTAATARLSATELVLKGGVVKFGQGDFKTTCVYCNVETRR